MPVYSGILRADQRSDLSFLRTGQVVLLTRELGETFLKGEILARLDSTELSFAVEELSANLIGAEADLVDAQLDHDRLLNLVRMGAVSQSEVDSAIARLNVARARITSIEASIAQAEKRLEETALAAPFDGQVVARLIEPSQTAVAGQTVYRVIGNDGGLEAVVNVPVSALVQFSVGYETDLLIRPSEQVRRATVTEVGNAAGLSGLFPVTLTITDSEGLRPGLRVEVPGQGWTGADAMPLIPLTAYLPLEEAIGQVFLIDPDTGHVSVREVQLGSISDRGIEVVSGLDFGAVIVARGLPSLRDGERVIPLGRGIQRFNQ